MWSAINDPPNFTGAKAQTDPSGAEQSCRSGTR